jgi:hypothetical protein
MAPFANSTCTTLGQTCIASNTTGTGGMRGCVCWNNDGTGPKWRCNATQGWFTLGADAAAGQ